MVLLDKNLSNKIIIILLGLLVSIGGWIGNSVYANVNTMQIAVHQIDKRLVSMETKIIAKDEVLERLINITLQMKAGERETRDLVHEMMDDHRAEREAH